MARELERVISLEKEYAAELLRDGLSNGLRLGISDVIMEQIIIGEQQMKPAISDATILSITFERAKQRMKFGHFPLATRPEMVSILGEEFGEVCRAVNQELSEEDLRKEVLQVAAVAIAYLDGDLHHGKTK